MNQHQSSTTGLPAQLAHVKSTLISACSSFASSQLIRQQLGSAHAARLAAALSNAALDGGLTAFRSVLHTGLVECLRVPSFDSTPYWEMIEAINLWSGAHPGAWKHMTDDTRQRWIAASLEKASAATSGVTVH